MIYTYGEHGLTENTVSTIHSTVTVRLNLLIRKKIDCAINLDNIVLVFYLNFHLLKLDFFMALFFFQIKAFQKFMFLLYVSGVDSSSPERSVHPILHVL